MKKPGHSKARQTKRAKTLDRRRGRKPGKTPLHKHAMRFEVAVYGTLVRRQLSRDDAAEFAASVFNESVKVTAIIEGGRPGLCFDYTGGRGDFVGKIKRTADGVVVTKHRYDYEHRDARLNRREKILDEGPKMIEDATGFDQYWLEASMQALDGVLIAVVGNDAEILSLASSALKLLGWSRSLLKVIPSMCVAD
jgi:hypothetical protein